MGSRLMSSIRVPGRLLAGASVVVNAAQYHVNLAVMEGALRAGCHYLDLGGLFHTTRRQLELERYTGAGLERGARIGSCPGIANVHAGDLGSRLDEVRSVRSSTAPPSTHLDRITWPYSLWTILDEVTQRPVVFRDGEFVELEPLSEEEPFPFVEPIGYATTSRPFEVATIPVSLAAKGIERCEFKILLRVVRASALQTRLPRSIGLASTDPRTGDARRGSPPASGRPPGRDIAAPTGAPRVQGHRHRGRGNQGTVSPPGSGWTQRHGRRPSWASAAGPWRWRPHPPWSPVGCRTAPSLPVSTHRRR